MGDAHGRVGGVHRLAAVAAAAVDIDAQVARVDFDIGFFGFGQHGDGGGGGVDAALALGDGHALHAVDAGFEFQVLIGFDAAHGKDDFLEAADFVRASLMSSIL